MTMSSKISTIVPMTTLLQFNYDNNVVGTWFEKGYVSPKLPARRWGGITTKISDSNRQKLVRLVKQMNEIDKSAKYKVVKNEEETLKWRRSMWSVKITTNATSNEF